MHQSISAAAFSSGGQVLAYASGLAVHPLTSSLTLGYDWHEGIHGYKNEPVNIHIGMMKDSEIQPKSHRR